MDPNSENAFPERILLIKLGIYQDYSKILIFSERKTEKIMFGLENRCKALIFMSRNFDKTLCSF